MIRTNQIWRITSERISVNSKRTRESPGRTSRPFRSRVLILGGLKCSRNVEESRPILPTSSAHSDGLSAVPSLAEVSGFPGPVASCSFRLRQLSFVCRGLTLGHTCVYHSFLSPPQWPVCVVCSNTPRQKVRARRRPRSCPGPPSSAFAGRVPSVRPPATPPRLCAKACPSETRPSPLPLAPACRSPAFDRRVRSVGLRRACI